MGISEIISQIDQELAQLEKVRALLVTDTGNARGRASKAQKKKRNLSPEGRKRIAEAVKRRWAAQKKKATSDK